MGEIQIAFAEKLGWTESQVSSPELNALIKGKRGITTDTAIDLAEALGTSPKLWMNLQVTWYLEQTMKSCKSA